MTTLDVLPLERKVTSTFLEEPSKHCAFDLIIEEATCSCILGDMVSKALTMFLVALVVLQSCLIPGPMVSLQVTQILMDDFGMGLVSDDGRLIGLLSCAAINPSEISGERLLFFLYHHHSIL